MSGVERRTIPVSSFQFRTVIIAISASSFEEERAVVLAAGCDAFLRKPFREADVFEMMHQHLVVRYVYAESERHAAEEARPETADVLTPAALAALPADVRVSLQAAVECLDVTLVNTIIDQIRQQNTQLANALRTLIDKYRFDAIQAIFEKIDV